MLTLQRYNFFPSNTEELEETDFSITYTTLNNSEYQSGSDLDCVGIYCTEILSSGQGP